MSQENPLLSKPPPDIDSHIQEAHPHFHSVNLKRRRSASPLNGGSLPLESSASDSDHGDMPNGTNGFINSRHSKSLPVNNGGLSADDGNGALIGVPSNQLDNVVPPHHSPETMIPNAISEQSLLLDRTSDSPSEFPAPLDRQPSLPVSSSSSELPLNLDPSTRSTLMDGGPSLDAPSDPLHPATSFKQQSFHSTSPLDQISTQDDPSGSTTPAPDLNSFPPQPLELTDNDFPASLHEFEPDHFIVGGDGPSLNQSWGFGESMLLSQRNPSSHDDVHHYPSVNTTSLTAPTPSHDAELKDLRAKLVGDLSGVDGRLRSVNDRLLALTSKLGSQHSLKVSSTLPSSPSPSKVKNKRRKVDSPYRKAVSPRRRVVPSSLESLPNDLYATESDSCSTLSDGSSDDDDDDEADNVDLMSSSLSSKTSHFRALKNQLVSRLKKKETEVQDQWDNLRTDVGWRWSWLRAQISVLNHRIEHLGKLHKSMKDVKSPINTEKLPTSCARSRPYSFSGRRRIVHDSLVMHSVSIPAAPGRFGPPTNNVSILQNRAALMDSRFHPVLSMYSDIPSSLLHHFQRKTHSSSSGPSNSKPSLSQNPISSPSTTTTPGPSSNHSGINSGSLKREREKDKEGRDRKDSSASKEPRSSSPAGSKKERSSSPVSPSSPDSLFFSPGSPQLNASSSSIKGRQKFKSRLDSVDQESPSTPVSESQVLHLDLSLSSSMSRKTFLDRNADTPPPKKRKNQDLDIDSIIIPPTFASTRVESIQVKEIPTPLWTVDSSQLDASTSNSQLPSECAEDISDASFIARHEQCESEEKKFFVHSEKNSVQKKRLSREKSFNASLSPNSPSLPDSPENSVFRDKAAVQSPLSLTSSSSTVYKISSEAGFPPRAFPLTEDAYKKLLDDVVDPEQQADNKALYKVFAATGSDEDSTPSTDPRASTSKPSLKLVLRLQTPSSS